jgi:GNAT superfamily N-acetyltransferase
MDLIVRAATASDLPAVLALLREDSMHYFDEPHDVTDRQRAAFEEVSADPNQELLVGELDGRVVATAQVTWMRMLAADGGLYCQVEAVRTAADLRGRGIGAALMAHVEDEARRRGAARIQLTSNRKRTDAHRFYARLGFETSHVGMKKYL